MQDFAKQPSRPQKRERANQHTGQAAALLAFLALLVFPTTSRGQTSSILDSVRWLNTTAGVGDTFEVSFYLRNVDTLAGISLRARFDESLIEPLTDTNGSSITTEFVTHVRGTQFQGTGGDPDDLDSIYTWETAIGSLPDPGVLTFLMLDGTILCDLSDPPGPPCDLPVYPASLFKPGAGVTWRMKWLVKAGATAQTTTIVFENDPQAPSSFNTLVDIRARIFKRPSFGSGAVTITTDGPPPAQGAPTVQQPSTPVDISQGDLVTFPVTATDPDGDSLSLLAFNLPSGAVFTPNNPVKGKALVSGTFRWTPSFTQSGSFVVSFQATDSAGLTSAIRNVTINVVEVPRDLLFTTSTEEQIPQGGVPGAVGVVIPVNFVQVQSSFGVQFDFVYDPASFTPTQVQPSDRLDGFTIYDNVGELAGRIRIVAFSLNAAEIGAGSSSVLFNVIGNIPADAIPGPHDITFENAFESINPDPNVASVELATENGAVFVDFNGDVNLDGRIDVADVVNVVGYILGDFTLSFRQFVAADVVTDNLVDVFDLVEIINIIFGEPPFNTVPSGVPAVLAMAYDPNDGPNGAFRLTADLSDDVAGAQLEIKYDKANMTLGSPERIGAATGVSLYYRSNAAGRVTALLSRNPYQLVDARIPSGNVDLLRIPVTSLAQSATPKAWISDAKLSDPHANKIEVAGISPLPRSFALEQNYPNPFNASTVITFAVDGAAAATDARLEVFNVLGQKIRTLHNGELPGQGSYSFTWDGTTDDGNNVASGVYFYRLKLGDASETRKMVLLK